MPWKEMCYSIAVERAQGARIWDVDGNEYVDIAMGFGSLLLGHSPPRLIETLEEQARLGMRIGPHSSLAGEVAELISELTGMERVTFCNSGTEAVMTALRLARTVTRRSKIALFAGSYHGTFDGVMVRPTQTRDGELLAAPLAPGVPAHMIENVTVLEYDTPKSLDTLKAQAHELAAVLVEPVQSRRPDVQPVAYLREVRRLTKEAVTPLIFD
jgi:glutamate-1-semialdehyde aminotransferase